MGPEASEKSDHIESDFRSSLLFYRTIYPKTGSHFSDCALADSLGAMRFALAKALKKYNTCRPHKALDGLTPMAYIRKVLSGNLLESQSA